MLQASPGSLHTRTCRAHLTRMLACIPGTPLPFGTRSKAAVDAILSRSWKLHGTVYSILVPGGAKDNTSRLSSLCAASDLTTQSSGHAHLHATDIYSRTLLPPLFHKYSVSTAPRSCMCPGLRDDAFWNMQGPANM